MPTFHPASAARQAAQARMYADCCKRPSVREGQGNMSSAKRMMHRQPSGMQGLLQLAESLLRDLEIPYQVIETSTGDMGLGKFSMNDISWSYPRSPNIERPTAARLCTTGKRGAQIFVTVTTARVRFAHTLNNTAIASPQILVLLPRSSNSGWPSETADRDAGADGRN